MRVILAITKVFFLLKCKILHEIRWKEKKKQTTTSVVKRRLMMDGPLKYELRLHHAFLFGLFVLYSCLEWEAVLRCINATVICSCATSKQIPPRVVLGCLCPSGERPVHSLPSQQPGRSHTYWCSGSHTQGISTTLFWLRTQGFVARQYRHTCSLSHSIQCDTSEKE